MDMSSAAPFGPPHSAISWRYAWVSAACMLALLFCLPVRADVSVAQTPLTKPPSIKPNIMLMLDDSGSMAWSVMPDDPTPDKTDRADYELISSDVNGVYYNPSVTYDPPYTVTARPNALVPTTTRYAAAAFGSAWWDGFNQGGDTYNLSTYKGGADSSPLNSKPAFSHTFKVNDAGTYDTQPATCVSGWTTDFANPSTPGSCKKQETVAADCPNGYDLEGTQCVAHGGIEDPDCPNNYRFNDRDGSTTVGKCVRTREPECPNHYSRVHDSGNWADVTCRRDGNDYDDKLRCDSGYTLDRTGLEPHENDLDNLDYNQCYRTRDDSGYPRCPSGYTLTHDGCALLAKTPDCHNHPGYSYDASAATCSGTTHSDDYPPLHCPDGYALFGASTAGVECRKTITPGGTVYRSLFVYAIKNSDGSYTHHFVSAADEDTSNDSGSRSYRDRNGNWRTTTLPDSDYPGAGTCEDITQNDVTDLDTGDDYPGGVPVTQCHDDDTTRQNVANWFSYYHTRILMAKSGLMNAFATLDTDIRFGFGSINGRNDDDVPGNFTSGATKMAQVRPFGDGSSGTRREEFWTWVDQEKTGNSTPLRKALRDTGNYYKNNDQPWISGTDAPECDGKTGDALTDCQAQQLSCRQAYTILTTDGFWNTYSVTLKGDDYKIDNKDYSGNWDNADGVKHTDPNGVEYIYKAVTPYAGGLTDQNQSTLADVAMYYWLADLRTGLNDTVPTNSDDPAFWQHMTTFTVGLFDQDTQIPYKRSDNNASAATTPEDIFAWAKGGSAVPGFAWPTPASDSPNNIGDLVHAGLNGHGGFYAAGNPDTFANGIRDALRRVSQNVGSGASLAANSTKLDTGTTTYQAIYYTGTWKGDLRAFPVNSDGTIATNATWVASEQMPAAGDRTITTCTGTCTATSAGDDSAVKVAFTTAATFDSKSQLCTDPSACLTGEADDKINYLRGDNSKDQSHGGTYRTRATPMGDIVDSQPVFVGEPNASVYARKSFASEYAAWATTEDVRTRRKLLYVAANDGMLHAFNADTSDSDTPLGREMFAYLPKAVIKSGIRNLSRPDYGDSSNPHQYYNDGELAIADAKIGTDWKTVLVGTTGRGPAQAVYALDVTDPDDIKLLWERSAGDGQSNSSYIGKVVGKPVIARVTGGSWVALMGNGYNSSNGTPALLQFDIGTGALSVYTTTGSSNDGLSPPAVWISDATLTDNISTQAYAGDLHGNVWAFDLDADGGAGSRLYIAKSSTGDTQPITGGLVAAKNPADSSVWVFFGTGSNLSTFDTGDGVQTWYGLIVQGADKVADANTRTDLKQRSIVAEDPASSGRLASRGITVATDGDMAGKKGWYIDLLPSSGTAQGERMVTPNQFQGSLLVGTSRLPTGNADPCNPSGSGWIMAIDPFTGSPPTVPFFDVNNDGAFTTDADTDTATASDGTVYVAAGVGFSSIANNPIFVGHTMLISFDNAKTGSVNTRPGGGGPMEKVSWRELVGE